MRIALGLTVALLLTSCGSGSDAGASACRTYLAAVEQDSEAVADSEALDTIKPTLSDLDDPTRRAFAELITAAAPDWLSTDWDAVDDAAAKVRSTCLAEHDVEVPAP